jgi:hypothetical protein
MPEYTQTRFGCGGRKQDERAGGLQVVSLAGKKLLFLNVRWKRLLVSLSGKKSCEINEWRRSF